MSVPKWTDERTATLNEKVSGLEIVTRDLVQELAVELETTTRSIAAKLRKQGHNVEKVGEASNRFDEATTAELRAFVQANSGAYTYAEIAENFQSGEYPARVIQGKLLSMELTGCVRPTPAKQSVKTYTDAEQATVLSLIQKGSFVEDIAEAVGKSVQSVRGKALSLFKAGDIDAMPKQKSVKAAAADPINQVADIQEKTVAEIAEEIGKTERGVKTMLTRRGLTASDYDGAAKKEKAQAA